MLSIRHEHHIRSIHIYFAASLVAHAALLMLPLTPPINSTPVEPRNKLFAVELLVSEQEAETTAAADEPASAPAPAAKGKSIQNVKPRAKTLSHDRQRNQAHEATVSLDLVHDSDARYQSYLGHLRSKIGSVWQYPQAARDRGLNGTVTVRFSIARTGRLEALSIRSTSSHPLLDEEALRTIRAAAPFQPFPREFTIEKLNVLASFEYEFTGR